MSAVTRVGLQAAFGQDYRCRGTERSDGKMGADLQIEQVRLQDKNMSVSLLNFGAITQGWWIGDTSLILGYDDPQAYLRDPFYHGAIVGQVANRIKGASFDLAGTRYRLDPNEDANTLHGGAEGLSRQIWTLQQLSDREAVMTYLSPDGEGGFPGEVRFELHVSLSFPNLTYTITAQPDRPTPISIAQHNYYTLGSPVGVQDFSLRINAGHVLETDAQGVPTGNLQDVQNTTLDFRTPGRPGKNVDHFYVLNSDRDAQQPIATIDAANGLGLRVFSDQTGAQVYTAGSLGAPFHAGAGLCIEPSGYPNAPNINAFPSMVFSPERPYHQTLTLKLTGT